MTVSDRCPPNAKEENVATKDEVKSADVQLLASP